MRPRAYPLVNTSYLLLSESTARRHGVVEALQELGSKCNVNTLGRFHAHHIRATRHCRIAVLSPLVRIYVLGGGCQRLHCYLIHHNHHAQSAHVSQGHSGASKICAERCRELPISASQRSFIYRCSTGCRAGPSWIPDRLNFQQFFSLDHYFPFHRNPTAARQGARLDFYASRDAAAQAAGHQCGSILLRTSVKS
jgi:hypothetical protein